jgi:signal transduction histidine kinase
MRGYESAPGPGAALSREHGLRAAAGAPIVVDQGLWGVMIASSKTDRQLPTDAEARIAAFTELVATAISNTESRAGLALMAEEQAALRRIAMLAAREAPPEEELFAAVVEEAQRVLPVEVVAMARFESDGTMTNVATSSGVGDRFPVGGRWSLGGDDVSTMVARTGRPARIDSYADASGSLAAAIRERGLGSSVGTPIVVEGRVWGVMTAASSPERRLPADTEARLASFTELVSTAMSNVQARAEVRRLADEQAALRRVATLVAREAPPAQIFSAVTEEVERMLGVAVSTMLRYEDDGTAIVVAGGRDGALQVGARMSLDGENVTGMVLRTGRPARIDDYPSASGFVGTEVRKLGFRSAVGCPILVAGRLWGALVAGSRQAVPLPETTEARFGQFTELVATAVSNIEARSELAASRARIVATADDERRRVVRDLHDGAQQRMVHTIILLKQACGALQDNGDPSAGLVSEALDHAERANVELRELAHGILPAVLTRGGLRAGVAALASRMAAPVDVDVSVGRLPATVEATAYFVVAEALTNVAKHARAGRAEVTAQVEDGSLAVQVRDDGVGGARRDGRGLVGLADRLAVLGGVLRIESPAGGGTLVAATIPLHG